MKADPLLSAKEPHQFLVALDPSPLPVRRTSASPAHAQAARISTTACIEQSFPLDVRPQGSQDPEFGFFAQIEQVAELGRELEPFGRLSEMQGDAKDGVGRSAGAGEGEAVCGRGVCYRLPLYARVMIQKRYWKSASKDISIVSRMFVTKHFCPRGVRGQDEVKSKKVFTHVQ